MVQEVLKRQFFIVYPPFTNFSNLREIFDRNICFLCLRVGKWPRIFKRTHPAGKPNPLPKRKCLRRCALSRLRAVTEVRCTDRMTPSFVINRPQNSFLSASIQTRVNFITSCRCHFRLIFHQSPTSMRTISNHSQPERPNTSYLDFFDSRGGRGTGFNFLEQSRYNFQGPSPKSIVAGGANRLKKSLSLKCEKIQKFLRKIHRIRTIP